MVSKILFWENEGVKGAKIVIKINEIAVGHALIEDMLIQAKSIEALHATLASSVIIKPGYSNYYSFSLQDWLPISVHNFKLYSINNAIYSDFHGEITWDSSYSDGFDFINLQRIKMEVSD